MVRLEQSNPQQKGVSDPEGHPRELHMDDTVTLKTPIRGKGGLLETLWTYYADDFPLINHCHAFTMYKQPRVEAFLTWCETKLKKAQECALKTMSSENWQELELI